jgi:hypothetical protein
MSKGWKAKYFKGFGSKKPTEPKHDSRFSQQLLMAEI